MRIIKTLQLDEYANTHPRAASSLRIWRSVVKAASWENFNDVRATYASADKVRLPSGRSVYIFNIAGNEFRLITTIHFTQQHPKHGRVYIRELMTHATYDKNKWKERH